MNTGRSCSEPRVPRSEEPMRTRRSARCLSLFRLPAFVFPRLVIRSHAAVTVFPLRGRSPTPDMFIARRRQREETCLSAKMSYFYNISGPVIFFMESCRLSWGGGGRLGCRGAAARWRFACHARFAPSCHPSMPSPRRRHAPPLPSAPRTRKVGMPTGRRYGAALLEGRRPRRGGMPRLARSATAQWSNSNRVCCGR